MKKDFEEITTDIIRYFDVDNIRQVLACQSKESLIPRQGEEISIYTKPCIPALAITGLRPKVYQVMSVCREVYKNNLVIIRVYLRKI